MAEVGMVIIGAGEAGARAAVELRTLGWTGPITLIGEERWTPYERPPLSKDLLFTDDEPSPVYILDNEKLLQYDIDFLSYSTVARIERNTRTVILADGRQLQYHRLLLATGARPRRISFEGTGSGDLLYLRTFNDTLTLRDHLRPQSHVVVIGGGFIGLEVAASAIKRGCSVTLLEVGSRVLQRGVPKEIADIVEARHRAAGVEFMFGASIEEINSLGDQKVVNLADGTSITCDSIIVGIGAIPETSLAASCNLEIENGVRVDEMLRTSDPYIFAVGDCCSFTHKLYGGKRIRLEAWRNAQDQGIHVVRNMLGAEQPYTTVPWFWSDQYELTLLVTGLTEYSEIIIHRDMGDTCKFFFHLTKDGRLVAASAIGPNSKIAKDIRFAEMLIQQQAKPDQQLLANPDVKLKTLLQGVVNGA